MRKIWNIKNPDAKLRDDLASALGILPLTAQLLINRGIATPSGASRFLSCALTDLYNPFLMKGMDKAVERIKIALQKKEKITIWGDYDVDGLTSVALLKTVLVSLAADVSHYIPNRIGEGYGLNMQGIEKIKNDGTKLLITVDCGINSIKEVEFLSANGIDTIITDHHHILDNRLPKAVSVINPLQARCSYPFKYLSGVGVAFKLSQALTGRDLFEHLDLVALGTISDIVPMLDENRILAKRGLESLSKTKKTGLLKLLEKVGLTAKDITTMHAGFLLGPRLNATGRVGSCENSLKLLMSETEEDAKFLAQQLDDDNRLRQKMEADTLKQALAKVEKEINFKDHKIIVLHQSDWHSGVIGIVASRIVERFYRPTILLSTNENGIFKGSGRSIDNFHLFDALEKCSGHLESFGGHSKACGLSMKAESIEAFKAAINDYACSVMVPETFTPKLSIDAQIPLSLINDKLISQIELLSPFGPENPKPVFTTKAVSLKTRPRVMAKNTLKMWVSDGDVTCEAVGFKMAEIFQPSEIADVLDIVYSVGLNEWKGVTNIELNLKDIRACNCEVVSPV